MIGFNIFSRWRPQIFRGVSTNIQTPVTNIQKATTKIQNGCHKYSKELRQMSKWLPQISKWLPKIFKANLQFDVNYFILGNIYTWRSLETIILAALKRNLMLNSLKHNKLFPKLVYKELARNGIKRDWWNGLLKKSNISL